MKEDNAYILGTEADELYRLGLQHQVWAGEAQRGWELAGFTSGHKILDLGSGPGYCTKELAFIAGPTGRVIAIDQSPSYIDHVDRMAQLHGLQNIDAICVDYNHMDLEDDSLDGIFCRWALAWVPNPSEIIEKALKALKPGGRMVIHEYYDWSTHQVHPAQPALTTAIAAALRSFKESDGEIDIGRELPDILIDLGMELLHVRPMSKMATPGSLTWQWPQSFYDNYFPRLVELGLLTEAQKADALDAMRELTGLPSATLLCPMMVELIAGR